MTLGTNIENIFRPTKSDIYTKAIINYVDTERNICDAIGSDEKSFYQNCQYLKLNPDSSGEIHHPSAGDTCVIRTDVNNQHYIEKIYNISSVDDEGVPTRNLGSHSKYMPGDKVWLAKGGAFLALLRNGLAKIGVSPLCQIIFIKLESYIRVVSRNYEILTSGFRLYSVNAEGENVTRLSLFLQDSLGKEMSSKTSETSDFELVCQDNNISIMTGPKDPTSKLRENTSILSINRNGTIQLQNFDKKSGAILRKVTYTPNGCSEDIIFDGKNVALYRKLISRITAGGKPKVTVEEKIKGDYNIIVEEGHFGITVGKGDIKLASKNIFSVAEKIHSTECQAQLVDAKIKG